MTFQIVRQQDSRVTNTNAAVFTTIASPQIGGTEGTSLFTVQLQEGASGPAHVMDSEQIWHVLTGTVTCLVDGSSHTLQAGDTIRIAGDIVRQFTANTDASMLVAGRSEALARPDSDPTPIAPPWLA